MWWSIPLIPGCVRQRQMELCEMEASLVSKARSRPAGDSGRLPQKYQKYRKKKKRGNQAFCDQILGSFHRRETIAGAVNLVKYP